jgi:hypothetical protein
VTANGSDTFTVSGKVTDANGNVRAGDTVTISSNGDVTGGGTTTTDSSGNYTKTLTASTTADDETISVSDGAASNSKTLHEVAGAAASITETLTPSTVTANGTDTFVVSGKVTDSFGNPRSGDTVTISSSGDVVGGTTTTNSSGNYSKTLTASTTAGDESISVSDGAASNSQTLHEVGSTSTNGFFTDVDDHTMQSFDVLFAKGASNSSQVLKTTNPGTIKVKLDVTNTTGYAMNSGNGNTASAVVTVPGMPQNCGLGAFNCQSGETGAGTTNNYDPAFTLKKATAHPDDKTDSIPVTFQYLDYPHYVINGNSCAYNYPDLATASAAGWSDPTPKLPNGVAAKCIRASGFALPDKHFARISYQFQFRPNGSDGWPTNPDAKLFFRAGFSFAEKTTVTFTSAPTQTSNLAFGVVGAGQKVTAVGGYAYDQNASGIAGLKTRLFKTAPPANTPGVPVAWCQSGYTSSNFVAEDTTQLDGFFFIWRTPLAGFAPSAADQANSSAPLLPSGVQYTVVLCGTASGIENARYTLANKLSNQEFNEVDFRLISATQFSARSSKVKAVSKATRRAMRVAALRRINQSRHR